MTGSRTKVQALQELEIDGGHTTDSVPNFHYPEPEPAPRVATDYERYS